MDYGIQFTGKEQKEMREEARKELDAEEELDRLATEAAEAVDAKVKAEAEVAALNDDEVAEPDVGTEPITEVGPLDDEGYFSDDEDIAETAAKGGDTGAESSFLGPVDSLDDVPTTPGSSDEEVAGSGPSTPLDSPLGSIDDGVEDQGFVDGDDDSIPENKITPEGSTDEIQTDSELDEGVDELLPPDDDGLSAEQKDKKERKIKRKVAELQLRAMENAAFADMQEAAGRNVSSAGEDDPSDEGEADALSTTDPTPPTSSVPTPPASTTSRETAEADAVSTSEPTPPVSPVPTPEASTASTTGPGPFPPEETDRQVLRNSAAKRVMAALFPGDQHSGSEIAAKGADEILEAAASAVGQGRFPIEDAKEAKKLADAYANRTVNDTFMVEVGYACAGVAASLDSKAPGSIKERIVKQMEVNGTSATGEQPAQSI